MQVNQAISDNGPPSLFADRIAEAVARLDIEAALADYCIGIDDRDPDRWLSAFHEDAILEQSFPPVVCRGRAEILAWTRGAWAFQMLNHLSTNHRVHFIDQQSATGIAHAIALFRSPTGITTMGTARYSDEYCERDGRWRLAYRKIDLVCIVELPDARYLYDKAGAATSTEHGFAEFLASKKV